MIRLETLMNFLIDANLALIVAAFALVLADGLLVFCGYRRSYSTRLRLVMISVAIVAFSPLVFLAFRWGIAPEIPSFSDVMISQFLKGNISVHPLAFDSFLTLRETVIAQVIEGHDTGLIALAFVLGIAAMSRMIYVGMNIAKLTHIIRRGITVRRIGKVEIIFSDQVHVPFSTRGARRFFVVLPQSMMLDADLLKIAIGHELQHIRQRDLECEILAALVSPLFVLNPAYWYMSQKLRALREYSCDFAYLRRRNCSPASYAKGLVKVAETAFLRAPERTMYALSVPFVGRSRLFSRTARCGLVQRVNTLSRGETDKPGRGLIGGTILVLLVTMFAGTAMLQKSSGWSHDRIMMSTVVNLERLNSRNNP